MNMVINGIDIHFSDQGKGGPALVFLHYWGGSSRTWNEVIAALPPRARTVALDLRGWGDSAAPTDDTYALADFADDVEQLICALDLSDYVLVGHSMGGKIAQLLASRCPAGLAGLVLVAPAAPIPLTLPPQVRTAMESAYISAESVGIAIDNMLTAKRLSPGQRNQVIHDSLRGAEAARLAWPMRTSAEDISSAVERINVPTIVIAGELDKVDPVPALRAEVLSRIPQAVMHVLPGTGHLSPLESAAELAGLIASFVASLASNNISI